MKIRLDSGWMVHSDERILERLAEEGHGPSWMIASDLDYQRFHVARRCRMLAEAEFVEREQRDGFADEWYITTWGVLYLKGELDADLRRPDPGMRPGGRVRPSWYAEFG